jgi:hypothetical protein
VDVLDVGGMGKTTVLVVVLDEDDKTFSCVLRSDTRGTEVQEATPRVATMTRAPVTHRRRCTPSSWQPGWRCPDSARPVVD